MIQVLRAALADPRDNTKFTLVYASHTPADIILRDEIDALAAVHPQRFTVNYIVGAAPGGGAAPWAGAVGRVDKKLLARALPPPAAEGGADAARRKVLVCGPPGFVAAVSGPKIAWNDQGPLTGALKELGWSESQVLKL